jgi:hypothetical protein
MDLVVMRDLRIKAEMNDIRAYHASGVQGGKPWYRFLSKALIKVDDIVTIASEVQDDGERGEHSKVLVCLFSIGNGI